CGLSIPTSGQAIVAGYDVMKDPEKVKKSIGYMSQKFSLYNDLTIIENIKFYGTIYGMQKNNLVKKSKQLIDRLGLTKEKHTRVESLPLGWKQKLAFSISILHNPKIVFLDEPTGGVDPITRRQFWEMIYEAADSGITIFVTTHYMDEAEYCNRVAIMVDGKIDALDSPKALINQYKTDTMDDVFYQIAKKATRGD
ncbi:MAG: ABC transporter ATP-binding protein, partial [Saprospiraceae bacterium]